MTLREYGSVAELFDATAKAITVRDGTVHVKNRAALKKEVERLAFTAACGAPPPKEAAQFVLREAARDLGAPLASIHDYYMARGREEVPATVTVPANNLRTLTFDAARAIFRLMKESRGGAVIFEIARSEMGYTDQRPAEYASQVLAAAIAEGYAGPVFLQGDHIQVNAKRYAEKPKDEIAALKSLVRECLAAGFYNIDIDASTLVDLDAPTDEEAQRENAKVTAEMTAFIRRLEPAGVTVSIGGEIGEVGGRNSTPEDFHAFMKEYRKALPKHGDYEGISKISIQTGTTHGGVPLPDGSIADVAIAFDVLEEIGRIAVSEYGLGGAVQHGASTLPDEAFHKFVECGAVEVHLATAYQNLVYDHMDEGLREEIYKWLDKEQESEKKEDQTKEQFYYKTRKKALGPFKRRIWTMANRPAAARALEAKFRFLFEELGVPGTRAVVKKTVRPVSVGPLALPLEDAVLLGADEPGE